MAAKGRRPAPGRDHPRSTSDARRSARPPRTGRAILRRAAGSTGSTAGAAAAHLRSPATRSRSAAAAAPAADISKAGWRRRSQAPAARSAAARRRRRLERARTARRRRFKAARRGWRRGGRGREGVAPARRRALDADGGRGGSGADWRSGGASGAFGGAGAAGARRRRLRAIFGFQPGDRLIERGVLAGYVALGHWRLDRAQLTDQRFARAFINDAACRRRRPARQIRQGLGEKRIIVSHDRFRSIFQ